MRLVHSASSLAVIRQVLWIEMTGSRNSSGCGVAASLHLTLALDASPGVTVEAGRVTASREAAEGWTKDCRTVVDRLALSVSMASLARASN